MGEDLYKMDAFNQILLKTIPFGMDVVDEEGNILFLNHKFKKILGESAIGKKCWSLYRDDKKQCKDCPLMKGIKIGETAAIETKGVLGSKIFRISHTGMLYKGKKAILEIFQDITERKKAEKLLQETKDQLEKQTWGLKKTNESIKLLYAELEAKNKELRNLDQLKSDFVSTVSHELRTPLSITKEGISLVLDKVVGQINEKQEKVLGMAMSNIDRLAGIIDDLLDVSKIESGKVELKKTLVDFSNLINDICVNWKIEYDKKHQVLNLSLPRTPVSIYIDHDKMIQVLTNLISNSIKYTPENGRIDVELKDKDGEVEVSVSDTGVGIAKDDLPKVFNRFQQFNRLPGPGAKGTGLGLAICKQLVQMHNGNITVKSKPDKGSKFTFSLPKMDVEEAFNEYIANGIKVAIDKNVSLSLAFIHIKSFDKLQKELGQEKACDLIKNIEKVTKGSLRRQADTVVRGISGLIVLLFDTKRENAGSVRNRIEEAINVFLSKGKEKWFKKVSVAIGSATYPDEAIKAKDLLNKARPKR